MLSVISVLYVDATLWHLLRQRRPLHDVPTMATAIGDFERGPASHGDQGVAEPCPVWLGRAAHWPAVPLGPLGMTRIGYLDSSQASLAWPSFVCERSPSQRTILRIKKTEPRRIALQRKSVAGAVGLKKRMVQGSAREGRR